MKKTLALLICVLLFSGFNWGGENTASTGSSTSGYQETSSYADSYQISDPAPSKKSMNVRSLATASQMLGTGTAEQKKARLASLRRVAAAFGKKNA
ncbi:MAG: hypothetical protein ACOY3K_00760 [Candidatus Omnitrophota bacterium]